MRCRSSYFWNRQAPSCLPMPRLAECWGSLRASGLLARLKIVLWGLYPGTAEPQTLLTGTAKGSPFHATMPDKNGKLTPIEGTYSILDADLREAVIVAHPGGRERAPKSQLMNDVLASIPEAVAIEHGNHILYTNPAFTQMFGYHRRRSRRRKPARTHCAGDAPQRTRHAGKSRRRDRPRPG